MVLYTFIQNVKCSANNTQSLGTFSLIFYFPFANTYQIHFLTKQLPTKLFEKYREGPNVLNVEELV